VKIPGVSDAFKDEENKLTVSLNKTMHEKHCKFLSSMSIKLLYHRSSNEILYAIDFCKSIYDKDPFSSETASVFALALDEKQLTHNDKFPNGKLYEYFAALAYMFTEKNPSKKGACNDIELSSDNFFYFTLLSENAGHSAIKSAMEEYVKFTFSDKINEINLMHNLTILGYKLDETYNFELQHDEKVKQMNEMVIANCPYFPTYLEAFGQEIARLERKSLALKAATERQKDLVPLRKLTIEKYQAKKWTSTRQASIAIYRDDIKEMAGKKLSEDRGQQTVYGWLLDHVKEGKKQP
jgi:hypothetical protein